MTRAGFVRALLACEDAREAGSLVRAHPDLCDRGTMRRLQARFNTAINTDLHQARTLDRVATTVARRARDEAVRGYADHMSAVRLHRTGDTRRAEALFVRAKLRFIEAGDLELAGDVCRNLVDVRVALGDSQGARAALREARALYRRASSRDPRRLGSLALHEGHLHHRRDDHTRALAAYARSRSLFERCGESTRVALAEYHRGNVLMTIDRTVEARETLERCRDEFARRGHDATVTQADRALAEVDRMESLLDAGLARLDDVRARREALGDVVGVAHCDLEASEILCRLNRFGESEVAARRAKTAFRRASRSDHVAACEAVLGGLALHRGRPTAAVRHFEGAREKRAADGNRTAAAHCELGVARGFRQLGRYREAVDAASRAVATFGRARLRRSGARARLVRAEAAFDAGRHASARKDALAALAAARSLGDLRIQLGALLVVARLEEHAGRPGLSYRRLLAAERCVERLRTGLSREDSLLAFARDKLEVYEALVRNRLDRGGERAVREALRFAERGKARVIVEHLATTEIAATPGTRDLIRRLSAIERRLSVTEERLESGATGVRKGTASALRRLRSQRSHMLECLGQAHPVQGALVGAPLPDPNAVIAGLGPGEVVLEYAATGGSYQLFEARRDGVRAHVDIAREADVARAIDRLRFHLGKGVLGDAHAERFAPFLEAGVRGHLEHLARTLLGPVWDRLGNTTLRIIPHGNLHGVPFHAFELGGQALIDRAVVSYAPSLAVLSILESRSHRGSAAPIVLGVADGNAPAIDEEISAVRRHLPESLVLSGAGATGAALLLSQKRPPLLHIACHGVYEETGAAGGLKLGDTWITSRDLFGLEGTGELVVLSGCETGRGAVHSGDNWIGLVSAFLKAGARAVVAALWEVHDRTAVGLMDQFYDGLRQGLPVAEALASAQRRARSAGALALHWAPFTVVGDGRLRVSRREVA